VGLIEHHSALVRNAGIVRAIVVRFRATARASSLAIDVQDAILPENLDSKQIEVEEQGGTVLLCRSVHCWYEREDAERLAWAAPGENAAENCLEITRW
jgi:hypothetical protein